MNKSSIPNIFTFINLSLGIISIIICFEKKFVAAGLLIILAAFIDRYDGKIARKFNAVSLLGKELDSLSDLVSFGVAPAVLAFRSSIWSLGVISYAVLLLFPICGAFRLARFNVTDFKNVYTGIPITLAGSFIALDAIATMKMGVHAGLTAVFMVLLAYLMVSSIQVKKF